MSADSTRELLANLLKRREELRLESEALDKLIQTYRDLALLERESDVGPLVDRMGVGSRRARSAYVGDMVAAARRYIMGEGRPLTRSELLRRLESDGYVIDGKDKAKVLGTNLWRSRKFQHIDGIGYWPHDTPVPRNFAKPK